MSLFIGIFKVIQKMAHSVHNVGTMTKSQSGSVIIKMALGHVQPARMALPIALGIGIQKCKPITIQWIMYNIEIHETARPLASHDLVRSIIW